MPSFQCQPCKYVVNNKSNYNKHTKTLRHLSILNNIDFETIEINHHGIFYQDTSKYFYKQKQHKELSNNLNLLKCEECGLNFNTSFSYKRHIRTKHSNSEEQKQLLSVINDLRDDIKHLKEKQANTTSYNNNSNNVTNNLAIAGDFNQNNMKINIMYLNENYSQMMPIRTFIENIQDKYKLSLEDAKRLLRSRKAGIRYFQKEFSKLIKEKCQIQIKDLGIEMKRPDMFPVVTTDSNLRTHNEKTKLGWQRTSKTDNLEEIYRIYNDQIFQLTNQYIYLDDKAQNALFNHIRKDNFILSDNLNGVKQQQMMIQNGDDPNAIYETELSIEETNELQEQLILKRQEEFERKKKEYEEMSGLKFKFLNLEELDSGF